MARARASQLKKERNDAIIAWRRGEARAPKKSDIDRVIYDILAMNNAKDAKTKINMAFKKGSGHVLNVAKFQQLLDLADKLSIKNKYRIQEDTQNYIRVAPDYKGNKNIDPDTFDTIHKYLLEKIVGKIESIGEAFDNAKSIGSKDFRTLEEMELLRRNHSPTTRGTNPTTRRTNPTTRGTNPTTQETRKKIPTTRGTRKKID